MIRTTVFDVLIVYSNGLCASASSLSKDVSEPFAKGSNIESYNIVYGYFLKTCQRNNVSAAFTTSSDIIGPGQCKSYWLFKKNTWVKVRKTGYSTVIFDKFSPVTKSARMKRDLLFSSSVIKPFNHPDIFNLFFDKQKAYAKLSQFSIPTVTIENSTTNSIRCACKKLQAIVTLHIHKSDFSDEIVMKDRFGAGGLNVYKFKKGQEKKMKDAMEKNTDISYVIQPLVKFDRGFRYRNIPVSTDIRLIYLGGKIIQTYLRMAKVGEFRCNEHQGGLLKYVPKNEVPINVVDVSNKISKILNNKSSLYALDFIISNNGNIYLLEGNTGPGLDWNLSLKENEIEAQKLIRIIVKQLTKLAKPTVKTTEKEDQFVIPRSDSIDTYPITPTLQLAT